jgi:hypothetical protein
MLRALHRTGIILAFLSSGAALGTENALARGGDGTVEVGPYVSYSRFSNTSGIDESPGGGVRLNVYFSTLHSLEFDLDGGSESHEEANLKIRSLIDKIGIHYVRNYTPKGSQKMSPFVAFGVGRIFVVKRVENVALRTVTEGRDGANYLSVSGGVRYFYTPRVALRIDAKMYRWQGVGVTGAQDAFFSLDVTAGVSFLLGSEKQAAPAGE